MPDVKPIPAGCKMESGRKYASDDDCLVCGLGEGEACKAWENSANRAMFAREAARPVQADDGLVERTAEEEHFKAIIGYYESPEDIALGLAKSADYFRGLDPSEDVPQPRIVAEFHSRASTAIMRLLALSRTPSDEAGRLREDDLIDFVSSAYPPDDIIKTSADLALFSAIKTYLADKLRQRALKAETSP